jgi:hypothetical protein
MELSALMFLVKSYLPLFPDNLFVNPYQCETAILNEYRLKATHSVFVFYNFVLREHSITWCQKIHRDMDLSGPTKQSTIEYDRVR